MVLDLENRRGLLGVSEGEGKEEGVREGAEDFGWTRVEGSLQDVEKESSLDVRNSDVPSVSLLLDGLHRLPSLLVGSVLDLDCKEETSAEKRLKVQL